MLVSSMILFSKVTVIFYVTYLYPLDAKSVKGQYL